MRTEGISLNLMVEKEVALGRTWNIKSWTITKDLGSTYFRSLFWVCPLSPPSVSQRSWREEGRYPVATALIVLQEKKKHKTQSKLTGYFYPSPKLFGRGGVESEWINVVPRAHHDLNNSFLGRG